MSTSSGLEHESYLNIALNEAHKAEEDGEVPVGAIIVKNHSIIGRGYNQKERLNDPCAHAEIMAIYDATRQINDWRLNGCTLYSTLEPCPMCAGAILHARIDRVVAGARDIKWGAAGSIVNLFEPSCFNHRVDFTLVPHSACSKILTAFFKKRREEKNMKFR